MSTKLLGPARDPQNATERDVIVDAVAGYGPRTREVVVTIDAVHDDEVALITMTPQVAERLIESLQAATRTVREGKAWPADEFLREVVEPALELLDLNDAASRALLMGTAAVESELRHVRQIGGGPARGYFQMEPRTAVNLLAWLDRERPQYWGLLLDRNSATFRGDISQALVDDPIWAAMMARLRYRWIPAPLPAAADVQGMSEYWKKYYNTPRGKGTVEKFVAKFALVADALAAREAEDDDWRSDWCPSGIPGMDFGG